MKMTAAIRQMMAQRENFTSWLRDWNATQRARNELTASADEVPLITSEKPGMDLGKPAQYDKGLAVGQIRLISARLVSERPLLVAVIQKWMKGVYLITPYSNFWAPATLGEFFTGRKRVSERVLCSWNTRTVSANILKRSWVAGEMSAREVTDAKLVFAFSLTGASLPHRLAMRTGSPIKSPLDPRITYQEQERKLLNLLM